VIVRGDVIKNMIVASTALCSNQQQQVHTDCAGHAVDCEDTIQAGMKSIAAHPNRKY
jgi:hypothetical protein